MDRVVGFLGASHAAVADAAVDPEQVGPYRVLRRIGGGAMGLVYLAHQERPIERDVALKMIRRGLDTELVVARFEAERQVLSLMNHPNVATVYDAGATSDGRPYFVMELVEGVPITEYAAENASTLPERLELFVQVCEGVQHAHQKGIIHRDIKPSNVLVVARDRRATPKIIDFGIAKAVVPRTADQPLLTETGVSIGTREYMSPEQAVGSADIDTRTDVYSLGMLLYVLLAGALPFDFDELRLRGDDAVVRAIRDLIPPSPSRRLADLRAGAAGIEPIQLRGDLDGIVARAIEKERSRRYASPADLAADVSRYLRNEPVLARRPTPMYRLRKFVRRHRVGVIAAGLVFLGLVLFVGALSAQARRTAIARNRAKEVSEFLERLLTVSDPNTAQGSRLTLREVMDKGAEAAERDLTSEPEVQSQLLFSMGRAYTNLGLYSDSQRLLARSVDIRKAVLGSDHPDTLASQYALGRLYRIQEHNGEAEALLRTVVEAQRRVLGNDDPATFRSISELANALNSLGRPREAEVFFREALEGQRRLLGPDHVDTLASLHNLGNAVNSRSKAEALALYLEAFERQRRVLGENHPHTLMSMNNVADEYRDMGEYDKAETLHRDVLERRRKVLGPEHMDTVFSIYSLAEVAASRGRHSEALDWLQQAVDHGYRIPDEMASDTALMSLHGDPAFDARVARARQNAGR